MRVEFGVADQTPPHSDLTDPPESLLQVLRLGQLLVTFSTLDWALEFEIRFLIRPKAKKLLPAITGGQTTGQKANLIRRLIRALFDGYRDDPALADLEASGAKERILSALQLVDDVIAERNQLVHFHLDFGAIRSLKRGGHLGLRSPKAGVVIDASAERIRAVEEKVRVARNELSDALDCLAAVLDKYDDDLSDESLDVYDDGLSDDSFGIYEE